MEFIDNSILSKCDSNNNTISKTASTTDNQIEDTSSQKIVQNNILISDTHTKRKRKLSSDSLDSLNENNDTLTKSSPILSTEYQSSSLPIEKYLNETTGFNVKVINKNDKKLVKINLNNNTNSLTSSHPIAKQFTSNNNNQAQFCKLKTTIIKINNNTSLTSKNSLNEIDDLPSESDISNGTILIPQININSVTKDSNNNNITATKPLKICYKCNKCNKLFDNESLLKTHMDTICSTVELVKLSLNNEPTPANSDNDFNEIIDVENNNEIKQTNSTSRKRSFICNECGIQVKSQSELNKHMLHMHQDSASKGEQQYKCPQCHMSFHDISSRNRHEKEHSGLKPFRCYICSYEFTRASNLRSHLLKVHPNDIDKLVRINKTEDNKLKFEFDLDAINEKEKQRIKTNGNKSNVSLLNSTSVVPTNNAVIYIKDPNNKNADIQHMVVYIDGKPIFVENAKLKNSLKLNDKLIQFSKNDNQKQDNDSKNPTLSSSSSSPLKSSLQSSISLPSTPASKPVAKMPYLLAAAAAASNNRKLKQSSKLVLSDCARSSCYLINNNTTQSKIKDPSTILSSTSSNNASSSATKQDHEYNQLVSMFRQKNEKLYNPLLNKSF